MPESTPVHVVPTGSEGGIGLLAAQLADAAGAALRRGTLEELDAAAAARAASEPWHLHFSDRLFGASSSEAAERVARWAARGPVTLTFHDVPQPWAATDRKQCYVDVARAVTAWAANSHHEVALLVEAERATTPDASGGLGPGHVVPLPVEVRGRRAPTHARTGPVTLGVLGWIYPDKGHREVVRAAGRLHEAGYAARVLCLGAPVPGHSDLVEELEGRAERAGVQLSVSGFLDEADLEDAMAAVDVPVAAHQHLSASASINSWLAVGRRPLVADGRYARELAALRAGTLVLFDGHDPDGHGLDHAVRAALEQPSSTWLPEQAELAPRVSDAVASYRAWWAATTFAGPHPAKPVVPAW